MATTDRTVRHIGATKRLTRVSDAPPDGIQDAIHDVTWTFSDDVVTLPDGYDGYHRKLIREGALIAADAQTARAAGVQFRPVDEVIAAEHEAQNSAWNEQHGVDLPGYKPKTEKKEVAQ